MTYYKIPYNIIAHPLSYDVILNIIAYYQDLSFPAAKQHASLGDST